MHSLIEQPQTQVDLVRAIVGERQPSESE